MTNSVMAMGMSGTLKTYLESGLSAAVANQWEQNFRTDATQSEDGFASRPAGLQTRPPFLSEINYAGWFTAIAVLALIH